MIFGVFVPVVNAVSPADRSWLIAVGACVSAKSAAVHPAAVTPAFVIDEIDAVTVEMYWLPDDPFVILNSMSWLALPGYMPDTVLVCVMVTAEAVPGSWRCRCRCRPSPPVGESRCRTEEAQPGDGQAEATSMSLEDDSIP